MREIATLTMNPAVDKSTRIGKVRPDRKLRCDPPRWDPGGGGVNVARALARLGGDAVAYYLAGGPPGDILSDHLEQEGVRNEPLPIEDWTRESLHVEEGESGQQYRFGMPGPEVTEREWQGCLDRMAGLDPAPGYLVASGSLSRGVPDDFYRMLGERLAGSSTRLVVDTSGEPLRRLPGAGAYLVKPNSRELEDLAGRELEDEDEQVDAAREAIAADVCEVVALSLGRAGAMVVTAEHVTYLRAPTVRPRSKVGAGDSMVAGIVRGLSQDMDLTDAVRFGVAAASAAVTTPGTELCRREDAERLYERMRKGEQ